MYLWLTLRITTCLGYFDPGSILICCLSRNIVKCNSLGNTIPTWAETPEFKVTFCSEKALLSSITLSPFARMGMQKQALMICSISDIFKGHHEQLCQGHCRGLSTRTAPISCIPLWSLEWTLSLTQQTAACCPSFPCATSDCLQICIARKQVAAI